MIVKQRHEVLEWPDFELVELAGRTCYKSEEKIVPNESYKPFVRALLKRKHGAMIEFATMTVKFITDRGVSHELVRHRLCSFAQESTRYCNYKHGVTFIEPSTFDSWSKEAQDRWLDSIYRAAKAYEVMLDEGLSPQQARAVLPNSLKTEIIVKANIREWLHIFNLRCASDAHPDMQALMKPLEQEFNERYGFLLPS
jgi:thymidylate synthase (FAD)